MKKALITVLFTLLLAICTISATAEEGVHVTDYSLFTFDYGVESQVKDAYYIAYIKNDTNSPVYITTMKLTLYDENNNYFGVSDNCPYSFGSEYLDPGEITCMAFLTYFGENNYNKNAKSAKLDIQYTIDVPDEYIDINLDESNSILKGWFDPKQYAICGTIKNKNIKEKDKCVSYAMVLEDQNGKPIYMTGLIGVYEIPQINKVLECKQILDPEYHYYKKMRETFVQNNIVPSNAILKAWYMKTEPEVNKEDEMWNDMYAVYE